jgi:hypothetical protein
MAPGSATPPADEPPRLSADAQASQQSIPPGGPPPRGDERYGPLSVLRTRKDDGRSLTLYSIAPGDDQIARNA